MSGRATALKHKWPGVALIASWMKVSTQGEVAMSSMKLTEGPRREVREDAGSLETLRAQLNQQVHETAAAKGQVAALLAYMIDQMAPMVSKMEKKAKDIMYQSQLKDATIKQLTLQCQEKEVALQILIEVSKPQLVHSTAIDTALKCNAAH